MTIQVLFDDKRRKALNDAIREGKPLPIQAKKPVVDALEKNRAFDGESHVDGGIMDAGPDTDTIADGGLDEDGEGPDLNWGLEGINGSVCNGKFEGMFQMGRGMAVGGYEFTFHRLPLPHGPESGDVRMEIRSDEGVVWEGELPQGVQSTIEIPIDSKKIVITPLNLGTTAANMRISVEDQ